MANDCLVTKLKGTVDNSNLPYLGELDVNVLIKDSDIPNVRDLFITSPVDKTIYWESDKDVYDKVSTNTDRVNLGRSGSFSATKQLWCTETTKVRIHPMYDLVKCAPHTRYMGQINLDNLVLNGSTFTCDSYRGCTLYGHLDSIDFDLNIVDSGYDVLLPLSLNMKYDKVTVPTTLTCSLAWPTVTVFEKDRYSYIDKFFMDNVETGADICGILNGTNIASQLSMICLPAKNKVSVSNIELFNYQNCPNLTSIILHELISIGGNIVNAFKDNPNIVSITIVYSQGSSPIELRPLFDGWKAAGKRNSTCNFYFERGNYTVDGVDPAATVGVMKSVVFDANGDWTIE